MGIFLRNIESERSSNVTRHFECRSQIGFVCRCGFRFRWLAKHKRAVNRRCLKNYVKFRVRPASTVNLADIKIEIQAVAAREVCVVWATAVARLTRTLGGS